MIVSSSTFCPHPGEAHWDLSRLLHAAQHGTEALVFINHQMEAAASMCLAVIFEQIASGIPWLFRSTAVPMQLLYQYQCDEWIYP